MGKRCLKSRLHLIFARGIARRCLDVKAYLDPALAGVEPGRDEEKARDYRTEQPIGLTAKGGFEFGVTLPSFRNIDRAVAT